MALRRLAPLIALLAFMASAASAFAQPMMECGVGRKPMALAELFFGRNIKGRLGVTEMQWTRFVAAELTPRFPSGLTVVDAKGQWRDPDRKVVVQEPSKVVTIVLPGDAEDDARLHEIIDAYKARFQQQSVGLVVRPVCAAF